MGVEPIPQRFSGAHATLTLRPLTLALVPGYKTLNVSPDQFPGPNHRANSTAASVKGASYCGLSGGDSGSWGSKGWFRTCQYQYHHPQNSPTQKVTEKIIKIQGVKVTPTQRKKKNPAVKASFLGESMYMVMGVQGGLCA